MYLTVMVFLAEVLIVVHSTAWFFVQCPNGAMKWWILHPLQSVGKGLIPGFAKGSNALHE
jgi:hypothetical protein